MNKFQTPTQAQAVLPLPLLAQRKPGMRVLERSQKRWFIGLLPSVGLFMFTPPSSSP